MARIDEMLLKLKELLLQRVQLGPRRVALLLYLGDGILQRGNVSPVVRPGAVGTDDGCLADTIFR